VSLESRGPSSVVELSVAFGDDSAAALEPVLYLPLVTPAYVVT
jgi:hypothetical protein